MAPQQRPPPALRGGKRTAAAALSEAQKAFAAEHHGLIYAFLNEERWSEDEFYDIAALGYLRAVLRYDAQPKLRRFDFSTIAWANMKQSVSAYRRAEERRMAVEQRYMEASRTQADPFEDAEYDLLLHALAAVSQEKQYELAELRVQGYSIAEIAAKQGMSTYRVRKMIKELFRVYLNLTKEGEKRNEREENQDNLRHAG